MQDDNASEKLNTESSIMDLPEPEPQDSCSESHEKKSEETLEPGNPKRKKGKSPQESHSPHFQAFMKELNEQNDLEAKLGIAISYMEKTLSSLGHPDFKGFWDARTQCLAIFKENVPPLVRSKCWTRFSELSKEARRMKDALDEQSDFAAEQIDIAITAIEKDLDAIPSILETEPPLTLPERAETLHEHFDFYNMTQRELAHLNLLASRITSLRKELIKTEMRIRTKNKFFDRLSKAGDRIFPRRKELIHNISHQFIDDVEGFIRSHFGQRESNKPIFDLREEIKALQHSAKLFTLNTQAFNKTRVTLSECWDTLKEKDKERKAEFDKKREAFKENCDALKALISSAEGKFESGELNLAQSSETLEGIVSQMRLKELSRDDVRELRSLLDAFRDKIAAKQKLLEAERLKVEEARESQRRELYKEFHTKIQNFIQSAQNLSSEEILKTRLELEDEFQKSALKKQEKLELEKCFKPLKEVLREKKEAALLALPSDDRDALKQLQELLKEKQEHLAEIEEKKEHYRKLLGASGVGFGKGLEYNALLAEEKAKWEKALEAVQEVERKIEQLESKLS